MFSLSRWCAATIILVSTMAPVCAQETKSESTILSEWKHTARQTAVGNQLIQILNSANGILARTPKHKQSLYMRGYLLGVVGCTGSAIMDLTKAIEADPSYAAAYTERAICYMDLKQFDKAKVDLDRAVLLNPRSGDARFARGKVLLEMNRPNQAVSDLSACTTLAFSPALPGELPANFYGAPEYYLGACYEAMEHHDTALKYYKSSIKAPRLGGSGYIHRYSDQPLDAKYRVALYEGSSHQN
ncbi:MAG: tetratricopeptide repeat protein [Candidatus Obscuribacterales bacterium]|nr:tetratricopeptide repeat protein [Candidatus Obscuribacterales bacterium]